MELRIDVRAGAAMYDKKDVQVKTARPSHQ